MVEVTPSKELKGIVTTTNIFIDPKFQLKQVYNLLKNYLIVQWHVRNIMETEKKRIYMAFTSDGGPKNSLVEVLFLQPPQTDVSLSLNTTFVVDLLEPNSSQELVALTLRTGNVYLFGQSLEEKGWVACDLYPQQVKDLLIELNPKIEGLLIED